MGILMIHCPRTGRAIPTGYEMNSDEFARAPVFFARTRCPVCASDHEWFAPQAWVCESPAPTVRERGPRDRARADRALHLVG